MQTPLHCRTAAAHAEKLLAKLGITALPVDPFDIAKKHQIEVQPKPSKSPGVSGFLLKVNDTFGIMYATHITNEGFIRFTVAHELGHYFLPGHPEKLFPNSQSLHQSRSGFVSRDKTEEEADHFAAALLMPTDLFNAAIDTAGEGFKAIDTLATLCKTSITATAIRFAIHSPDPVAIIVSTGQTIDYCFMSDVLREVPGLNWIRKGELVPADSATHTFNNNKGNIESAARAEAWTNLDLWFDGAPTIDMKEDVVGLGTYAKTLTVLFTDEALPDEEDSDEYGD